METAETNQNRADGRVLGLAAVLVFLTVIAYLPALGGRFVFDDYLLIIGNRMVKPATACVDSGLRRKRPLTIR